MENKPRSAERIPKVLALLKKYWSRPENVDLRLGQLIYNLNKEKNLCQRDLFFLEDDLLVEILESKDDFETIEIDLAEFNRETLEYLITESCNNDISVNDVIVNFLKKECP